MIRLVKIGAAASALMAVGLFSVPASLAAGSVSCNISGNGDHSHNTCTITINSGGGKHGKSGGLKQINNADVSNTVVVSSSTGGNKANENTGGNVTIGTGDSNVMVSITNIVNSNSSGTP